MSKKKRKPAKPTAPVAMKAPERAAPVKPPLTVEQLGGQARRALAEVERAVKAARAFDLSAVAFLERRAGRSTTPLEAGAGEALADGHRASLRFGQRGRVAKRCSELGCVKLAEPGRHGCDEHSSPADEVTEDLPPPPQADPPGEFVVNALVGGGQVEANPVPAEVARCYEDIAEGALILVRAQRRLERLRRNPRAGRELTSEACQCCGKTPSGLGSDRLRAGFCNACDVAWREVLREWTGPGAPDRVAFIQERRARLEQQGKLAS